MFIEHFRIYLHLHMFPTTYICLNKTSSNQLNLCYLNYRHQCRYKEKISKLISIIRKVELTNSFNNLN